MKKSLKEIENGNRKMATYLKYRPWQSGKKKVLTDSVLYSKGNRKRKNWSMCLNNSMEGGSLDNWMKKKVCVIVVGKKAFPSALRVFNNQNEHIFLKIHWFVEEFVISLKFRLEWYHQSSIRCYKNLCFGGLCPSSSRAIVLSATSGSLESTKELGIKRSRKFHSIPSISSNLFFDL